MCRSRPSSKASWSACTAWTTGRWRSRISGASWRKKGATARAGQGGSFSVEQIAQLYNFPGGETGAGQCIAIIELNDIDT